MVAIFPNVCLWRRSYAQNWEVLTLKNCYSIERPMLLHHLASFLFYCFVKIWATCKNFLGKVYRPPWQKIARMPTRVQSTVTGKREGELVHFEFA